MLNARPNISIAIKALNEESRIAAAIESAMATLEAMHGQIVGEIVLADSASTDRTVEIAAKYPIKIVTLLHPADRSCGAGVQLAYQYSAGDFICLIDGDMVLHPGFVPAALDFLAANPQYAGVGGLIVERETRNIEYIKRAFPLVLRKLRWELFLFAAVHAWWLCVIVAGFLAESFAGALAAVTALAFVPFLIMALRCRSLRTGIYSATAWNVYAAGLWPGLLHHRTDPAAWIDSAVIRDAAALQPGHAA